INIEVQKENDDDHLKRVRYNGSILTTNITNPGTKFESVPDVCIIFISKFDIFKGGFPVYHVDKVVHETGEIINNGLTEIYVTTVKKDGSKVSKLMELFIKDDAYNIEDFPITSEIKARFKISEGGRKEMNEMLEKIIREEKEESEKRGAENEKIRMAKDMKKKSLPFSLIAEITGLSEKKILAL
ncbi:MAG: Rpn family recombination-promoting nuclease/putative transposase, partial [Catonella sp.]|uniref:Rpn family recombination-promoting nuclease/putative transposase n=1 Tax=Catonella sp. TaxID=2382125 RepID=UPI003F9FF06D